MNQPQLGSFESIPLSAIRPSGTNPRKNFDALAMEELTRSVQEMGVTQPLLLRPVVAGAPSSEGYEIVSGERRWRAAKAAGRTVVPAIVRKLNDEEALDIQMIENLQRADLHPVEEAEGFRVLMEHGATAEDVAKKSGKSLAHVQRTIRLLTLEIDARQLFADGHLTLGHALLLARLTAVEQDNALRYMLNGGGDYTKTPTHELIAKRIANYAGPYNMGQRLINTTEPQLKSWIQSNVFLQLAGVPWDLGDEDLLPVAGPCTTCPKRTGANAVLFQDLTTAEDTCTDPACFTEKQLLFTRRVQKIAADQGTPLLKISAKASNDKLEQKPVIVEHGHTTVVTKKAVKQGQWLPSAENACKATVAAVAVDGADQGKTSYVCADQNCKVHKHTVTKAAAAGSAGGKQESYEAKRARLDAEEKAEGEVKSRMLRDVQEGFSFRGSDFLQMFFVELFDDLNIHEARLCERLGIEFPVPKKASQDSWEGNRRFNEAAKPRLIAYLNDLPDEDLHEVAFHILALRAIDSRGYQSNDDEMKLAKRLVKRAGFDPARTEADVRKQIEAEGLGIALPPEMVSPSKPAKKAAAKKSAPKVDGKSAAAGAAAEQAGA